MNTMLRRTNHLVLIIASVTALAGTMSVSIAHAEPNTTKPADAATCKQWKGWYDDDTKRAKDATAAGNTQGAADAQKDADYDKKLGKDGSCDWAKAISVGPRARRFLHGAGVSPSIPQNTGAGSKAAAVLGVPKTTS